ncbi:hypothetical protein ElyMa_006650000 [Elysia marginata]|uniref:Uncharacterized protein n=1 Tax=Elysia marginata TaxID=1093978 RepID=A0AAV4IKM3_9GAST|nr:hypothetical protein ElyMa_006650000 [Elysia marginata]
MRKEKPVLAMFHSFFKMGYRANPKKSIIDTYWENPEQLTGGAQPEVSGITSYPSSASVIYPKDPHPTHTHTRTRSGSVLGPDRANSLIPVLPLQGKPTYMIK